MTESNAPYHAHIYYDPAERAAASTLRDDLGKNPAILFISPMADRPVGPHPIGQYEVHFLANDVAHIIAIIEATELRALVHPLTDDDLADHTTLAHWIGQPVVLDLTVLDPPGHNKGIARFGGRGF